MVNGDLPDFFCSFKFGNKKEHFICTLKSEKKYINRKQAEYRHTLKRRKSLSSGGAGDSNLGPLVYKASVLPTELSFRMKN